MIERYQLFLGGISVGASLVGLVHLWIKTRIDPTDKLFADLYRMVRKLFIVLLLLWCIALFAACSCQQNQLAPADGVATFEVWEYGLKESAHLGTHPFASYTKGDGEFETKEIKSTIDPFDGDHFHEYQWPADRAEEGVLRKDRCPERIVQLRGKEAEEAWRRFINFSASYPYKKRYRNIRFEKLTVGPNSNTFMARALDAIGVGRQALGWRAFGAGWEE